MSKNSTQAASKKSTKAPKEVEAAPAVKVVQNPANATARTTYEPVVHSTGTIGGKPARLAWYGTKYGALEIEQADGSFVVHHDTAFGGMRSVDALEGLFDSVAPVVVTLAAETVVSEVVLDAGTPVAEVLVLGPDMREIQLTAGNVAVVELDPADFAKAETNIAAAFPAPVVAAEPAYTTLEEVRAAHEAETRGACRASVLRALRVRAGEIALGVAAGGKAEKVKAERPAPREVVVDPTKAKPADVEALRTLLGACLGQSKIEIAASAFTAEAGFPATASEKGNHWRYDRPGVKAALALGYHVRFDGRAEIVRFDAVAAPAPE